MKYFLILTSIFFISGSLSAFTGASLLPDNSANDQVQFLIKGKLYDGYLGVDIGNRLRADVDSPCNGDGNCHDELLRLVTGYLVPAHQDVGLDVYLLGDRDDIAFRYGVVEEVYDNGYHKIGVYSESYHNGETIHLFKPQYIIIHKAVLLEDGGFGILK